MSIDCHSSWFGINSKGCLCKHSADLELPVSIYLASENIFIQNTNINEAYIETPQDFGYYSASGSSGTTGRKGRLTVFHRLVDSINSRSITMSCKRRMEFIFQMKKNIGNILKPIYTGGRRRV